MAFNSWGTIPPWSPNCSLRSCSLKRDDCSRGRTQPNQETPGNDLVLNPTKISVVIPTCNRRERLRETLLALANQSVEGDQFQVIVVPNGCTDGTAEFIEGLPFPIPVTVLSQAVAGRAKARNAGARAARADIVLFLDDDMEASR